MDPRIANIHIVFHSLTPHRVLRLGDDSFDHDTFTDWNSSQDTC